MRRLCTLSVLVCCVVSCHSVTQSDTVEQELDAESTHLQMLREAYSQPSSLWPKPHIDESVDFIELGLLPQVTFPTNNPYSEEAYKLGFTLFHDGALSASKQIACASCHDPDLGWGDGRRVSFGHNRQAGKRNAPTLENSAFLPTLFWDGRAGSLEQQALMPIVDPVEMAFDLADLEARLSKDDNYQKLFKAAYGEDGLSIDNMAKALATFQRTITSRRSDFDFFLLSISETDDRRKNIYNQMLSDQALKGLDLFRRKARCANCHYGPRLTDDKFHNLGLTWYKREFQDLGRYTVSGKAEDVGKFKTPGLRGVMNTKPWMHNGLFSSMRGILNIYDNGGVPTEIDDQDPLSPVTSPLLHKLDLSDDEKIAIVAFLESITAAPARVLEPK